MDLLAIFEKLYRGTKVIAVTFDGEVYRAELNNGQHIAFVAKIQKVQKVNRQ